MKHVGAIFFFLLLVSCAQAAVWRFAPTVTSPPLYMNPPSAMQNLFEFTAEIWLYNTGTAGGFVGTTDCGAAINGFQWSPASLTTTTHGTINKLLSPPLYKWTHYAVSIDANLNPSPVNFYENGQLLESKSVPVAAAGALTSTHPITLGAKGQVSSSAACSLGWGGLIAEFRLWDRVLPGTDISSRFRTPLGSAAFGNLVFYAPLDSCTPTDMVSGTPFSISAGRSQCIPEGSANAIVDVVAGVTVEDWSTAPGSEAQLFGDVTVDTDKTLMFTGSSVNMVFNASNYLRFITFYNTLSVELWVKPSKTIDVFASGAGITLPANQAFALVPMIGEFKDVTSTSIGISIGTNGVVVAEYGASDDGSGGLFRVTLSFGVTISQWTHILIVYNNHNPISLFIDGVFKTSGTYATRSYAYISPQIGGSDLFPDFGSFGGSIAGVRIYSAVVPDATLLYNYWNHGPGTNLVTNYYPLESEILSVTPSEGIQGTTVTITLHHTKSMVANGASRCQFGSQTSIPSAVAAGTNGNIEITCSVPSGLPRGTVAVQVSHDGTSFSDGPVPVLFGHKALLTVSTSAVSTIYGRHYNFTVTPNFAPTSTVTLTFSPPTGVAFVSSNVVTLPAGSTSSVTVSFYVNINSAASYTLSIPQSSSSDSAFNLLLASFTSITITNSLSSLVVSASSLSTYYNRSVSFTITPTPAPVAAVTITLTPGTCVNVTGGNTVTLPASSTAAVSVSLSCTTNSLTSTTVGISSATSSDLAFHSVSPSVITVSITSNPVSVTVTPNVLSTVNNRQDSFMLTPNPLPDEDVTITLTVPSWLSVTGGTTVTLLSGTSSIIVTVTSTANVNAAGSIGLSVASDDTGFNGLVIQSNTIPITTVQAKITFALSSVDMEVSVQKAFYVYFTPAVSAGVTISVTPPASTSIDQPVFTAAAGATYHQLVVTSTATPLMGNLIFSTASSSDNAYNGLQSTPAALPLTVGYTVHHVEFIQAPSGLVTPSSTFTVTAVSKSAGNTIVPRNDLIRLDIIDPMGFGVRFLSTGTTQVTVTSVSGTATFAGLVLTGTGRNLRINATDTAFLSSTAATSSTFYIPGPITVSSNSSVLSRMNGTTFKVSLWRHPEADITISLSCTGSLTDLVFSTSTLSFGTSDTVVYFDVTAGYTFGNGFISFALGGSDAAYYVAPNPIQVSAQVINAVLMPSATRVTPEVASNMTLVLSDSVPAGATAVCNLTASSSHGSFSPSSLTFNGNKTVHLFTFTPSLAGNITIWCNWTNQSVSINNAQTVVTAVAVINASLVPSATKFIAGVASNMTLVLSDSIPVGATVGCNLTASSSRGSFSPSSLTFTGNETAHLFTFTPSLAGNTTIWCNWTNQHAHIVVDHVQTVVTAVSASPPAAFDSPLFSENGISGTASTVAAVGAGFASSASMNGGDARSWMLLGTIQLLDLIRLVNIDYPDELNTFLSPYSWANFNVLDLNSQVPSAGDADNDLPGKLSSHGELSVMFIAKSALFLAALPLCLGAYPLAEYLKKRFPSFLTDYISKTLSGAFIQCCQAFLINVSLEGFIQLVMVVPIFTSGPVMIISFFLGIASLVLMCATVYAPYRLYPFYQSSRASYLKPLYNKYKPNPYAQRFELMYLGRRFILAFSLVCFQTAPLAQLIIAFLVSLTYVTSVLVFRPFKDLFLNIVEPLGEGAVFFVHLSTFCFYATGTDSEMSSSLARICILWITSIFFIWYGIMLLSYVITAYELYTKLRKLYIKRRAKRYQRVADISETASVGDIRLTPKSSETTSLLNLESSSRSSLDAPSPSNRPLSATFLSRFAQSIQTIKAASSGNLVQQFSDSGRNKVRGSPRTDDTVETDVLMSSRTVRSFSSRRTLPPVPDNDISVPSSVDS